ncbi:MAG TPA: tail fiber domain-containing protein [Rhodothermales bacterium]
MTVLAPAFDKPYWLGTSLEGEAELTPRIALTSSPYALNVGDGGGDGDITAVRAGSGLLGGAEAGDATLDVDTTFLDNRFINPGEAGSISSLMIVSGSVSGEHVAAGAISGTDIAAGAVSGTHIVAGAVTGTHIAAGTIEPGKLNVSSGSQDQVLTINQGAASWRTLPGGGPAGWSLTGNAGTTPGANFIGTTDGKAFEIRAAGVGIGTSSPSGTLHVSAGTSGDAVFILEADSDNNQNEDNPVVRLRQDGGRHGVNIGFDNAGFGSNRFGIGRRFENQDFFDSFVIETETGNVGIATNAPSSPLTVAGIVESKTGGFKFPDGSVQATAAGGGASWNQTGNSVAGGAFVGTTNDVPLELRTNQVSALTITKVTDPVGPKIGARFVFKTAGAFGAGLAINTDFPTQPVHIVNAYSGGIQIDGPAPALLLGSTAAVGLATANTDYSLAATPGDIVVRSAADADVILASSINAKLFVQGSTGNVGIGTTSPNHPLTMGSGAHVTAGGVWTNASSRYFKEGFEPIDVESVLQRVVAMPITKWRYSSDSGSAHIGPVAEDFNSAFGLGGDERFIGTVDADGVALAAIQGLFRLVESQSAEIARLRAEVAALSKTLAAE